MKSNEAVKNIRKASYYEISALQNKQSLIHQAVFKFFSVRLNLSKFVDVGKIKPKF